VVRDHSPQHSAFADLFPGFKGTYYLFDSVDLLVNGLLDPYSQEDQANFAKWYVKVDSISAQVILIPVFSDRQCPGILSLFLLAAPVLTFLPGEEHDASKNSGAAPSFCTLPLFHQPAANSAMADSVNGRLHFARHIDKATC